MRPPLASTSERATNIPTIAGHARTVEDGGGFISSANAVLSSPGPESVISIRTVNHLYRIEVVEEDTALISGHPEFCPNPVEVRIHGSTWGGSMLRVRFVGRGMHLEFEHPVHKRIVTSRILDIQSDEAA